jgi:hypothetical protein
MCCGRGRTARSLGIPNRIPVNPAPLNTQAGATFEYVGKTGLTVVGPITGASYRFERPGSRLRVDPRDRAGLVQVPVLRALK